MQHFSTLRMKRDLKQIENTILDWRQTYALSIPRLRQHSGSPHICKDTDRSQLCCLSPHHSLSVSLLIMDVLSNCDWKGNSPEDSWKALLNVSICLMPIRLPNAVRAKEHNSKWVEKQLIWQQNWRLKRNKIKQRKERRQQTVLQTEQILPALPINKKTAIEQRRNAPLWRRIQN